MVQRSKLCDLRTVWLSRDYMMQEGRTLGAFWMSRSAVAEVSIVTETKSNHPAVLLWLDVC